MTPKKSPSSETRVAVNKIIILRVVCGSGRLSLMTVEAFPAEFTNRAVRRHQQARSWRCLPIQAGKDLIWKRTLSSEAPSPACCRSLPQLVRTLSAAFARSTVQRRRYILLQQPQYKNKIIAARMVCLTEIYSTHSLT